MYNFIFLIISIVGRFYRKTNPIDLCNKCWSVDSNLKWTPCSNPDKVSCRTAGVGGAQSGDKRRRGKCGAAHTR